MDGRIRELIKKKRTGEMKWVPSRDNLDGIAGFWIWFILSSNKNLYERGGMENCSPRLESSIKYSSSLAFKVKL